MKNWLKDNYVILTGASSGIGKELCRLLICTYGAKVIGVGRSESKMLKLCEELGGYSERFSYYLFDVSEHIGWVNFKESLLQQDIKPILLLNNAGIIAPFAKIMDTSLSTIRKVLDTNFRSIVYSVDTVAPLLQGQGKHLPAIVNVASSASLCTVVGAGAYSASKAAVKAYTEALAMEEKGRKHVGLICPGTTATELFSVDENTADSALNLFAMPASKMAKKIARKVLKKRRRAVLGWDAKLMNLLAKLMPVKGLFLVRWVLKTSKTKVYRNVFKDE